MTDLETFKRHVGYRVKAAQETFTGTDLTVSINLRFEGVFDVEVDVDAGSYPATAYTVDGEAGVVKFKSPPGDESVVTIRYKYAPFTDAEAQALIDAYGLDMAVIEALRELLANVARLRNYKEA